MVGWGLLRTIDVFGSSVMYGVAYIVDRLYFVINPVNSLPNFCTHHVKVVCRLLFCFHHT